MLLKKLVDFIQNYLPYRKRKFIEKEVIKHLKYRTIQYFIDSEGEIVGLCRWNISDDGKIAHILDLIVREDYRKTGVARRFLKNGLKLFGSVKYLEFEREFRGDRRKRLIPIEYILKSKTF